MLCVISCPRCPQLRKSFVADLAPEAIIRQFETTLCPTADGTSGQYSDDTGANSVSAAESLKESIDGMRLRARRLLADTTIEIDPYNSLIAFHIEPHHDSWSAKLKGGKGKDAVRSGFGKSDICSLSREDCGVSLYTFG